MLADKGTGEWDILRYEVTMKRGARGFSVYVILFAAHVMQLLSKISVGYSTPSSIEIVKCDD